MSKCIVKILRDETPGGLAEKINKELEENTRSWDTVTGIKYQVAVIPIMRGKENGKNVGLWHRCNRRKRRNIPFRICR